MQTVKEFMDTFFRERLTQEEEYQKVRLPFRRRFFTEECRFDSRADTLARFQSEKIIQIDEEESVSRVVTDQIFYYMGKSKTIRMRYHLRRADTRWLIEKVQTACPLCEGPGDSNCLFCKGEQWRT